MATVPITVSIIGAGPAGNYLGYLLAKKGIKITIYEEHAEIGKPVQCTGILTESITKLMKLDNEFVINRINYVDVFSPNEKTKIKIKDIIVDRTKFDSYIAKMAQDAGAIIKTAHKCIGINNENGKVKFKTKETIVEIKSDFIIGADGPNSIIAKIINPNHKIQYYIGKQALVKGKFEHDTYQVYLDNTIAPKFFGWSVPENENYARIGVATLEPPSKYFDLLLERMNINPKNIIAYQGGLIPVYDPKFKVSMHDKKNNIQLAILGDAALQLKATTGGGIIPGMKAAVSLADWIIKTDNNNKTNPHKKIKTYEAGLKEINKELKLHLLMRKMLDKFTNKDYDELLQLLKKPKVKEELLKTDRDTAIKLAVKLVLKEPKLIKYGFKMF